GAMGFPGKAHRAQGRSYEIRVACVADGRSLAHPVISHGKAKTVSSSAARFRRRSDRFCRSALGRDGLSR
ncbi:hypothetical protein, partial [Xanthomonas campestris]|uniref:hypothetical protein n=1 Tax=Xanthomonas campestris TaxID=339 RepID=UPI002B235768